MYFSYSEEIHTMPGRPSDHDDATTSHCRSPNDELFVVFYTHAWSSVHDSLQTHLTNMA
jgi:hypothetical protein